VSLKDAFMMFYMLAILWATHCFTVW